MPSYIVHRRRARQAARTTLVVVFSVTWPVIGVHSAQILATSAAFATLVGGVLPDLDAQSSRPRRLVERLLTVGLYLVLGYSAAVIWLVWLPIYAETPQELFTALSVIVVVLIVGYVLLPRLAVIVLDAVIPTHRGLLHDFRFWSVLVGGMFLLVESLIWEHGTRVETIVAVECGVTAIGFLLGVALHLRDDDVPLFRLRSGT
jgi:hypothetical protein